MQIVIVKEATPGTTPSTPTGETLRCTSFDGNINPSYLESKEIRTDRQRAPGAMGTTEASPSFGGEASYGSLDTLLDLLLGGGWSPSLSGVNLAVDATAKTVTRASGSFVTDGFQVGQSVTMAGFANAGNNSTQTITTVAASVLTFSGATGLVTEAAAAGRTIAGNILKVGSSYVPSTCTLEHKDEGTAATKFQPYKGLAVSKLTISGGLGQNVEWSAEGPAMTLADSTASTLYSSITPANTNPVYGPANGQGSIKLNNVLEDGCTKWSITFDNSAQVNRACYNAGAHSVRQKGIKITASLDLYHEDQANYGRMTAGTEIPFQLTLGDGSTKSLQLDFARARVTSCKCPEGDGVRTETVELEMFVPTSGTDTACKITRKP